MQIITRGIKNVVVLTLNEKTTLTNPYFLFEIKNKTNVIPYYFIAADVSLYPNRYNKFNIMEVTGTATPENTLIGNILLSSNGEYEYRIFEQTSATNLNPGLSTNTSPIEVGFIKVEGNATAKRYYTTVEKNGKTYATGK